MSRPSLLLLLVLAGCSASSSAPPPSPKADPLVAADAEIDFANWPAAREHLYPVQAQIALFCEPPSPERTAKWEQDAMKKHGPHYYSAILVRVNPTSFEAFKSGKAPLPVGTTVIKEKHNGMESKGPPNEYAAMVKREAGYDPAHGDWEYVYVVRGPEKKVTRGKLDSCIDCHANKAEQDYVFRTYLK